MSALPQGLTEEQFARLSAKVRQGAAHLGQDAQIHGSRAKGTARSDSDLDIAIRVDAERFEQLLQICFGTPNPNSAKERTLLHARTTGKIQAGEAGLRHLRKELEAGLSFEVDLSIIRRGGPFDQGPYLPLLGPG
jgi:hypothetical protein